MPLAVYSSIFTLIIDSTTSRTAAHHPAAHQGAHFYLTLIVSAYIECRHMDLCHFLATWRFALSHPTLGYYTRMRSQANDSTVLGKLGDFITSPEISQVFGEVSTLLDIMLRVS